MNYEIIKVSPTEHNIVKVATQEIVATYTRMSSAKRGLERLLAKEQQTEQQAELSLSVADETDELSANAPETGAARATRGAGALAQPPASNTGGNLVQGVANVARPEKVSEIVEQVVMVNGELKKIPLRKGVGTSAHIDTLSLTFSKSVFLPHEQNMICKTEQEEDELILANAEAMVNEIFGFKFSSRGNGRNGYANTANMGVIGDERIKYGFFAWSNGDAQSRTVCLHISGVGATAALDNWEIKLYDWIKQCAPFAKITRVDLAHDFMRGEYTPLQAYQDWKQGEYKRHAAHQPICEIAGKGWLNEPTGGRTLYIGSKANGSHLARIYEKGIEQGDITSPWVRFELQIRSRDYIIQHEVLLNPGEWLTGAYPITEKLFSKYQHDAKKCERVQKMQEITIEHIVHHASIQVSPAIKALKHIGFDDEQIIKILERENAKISKRMHPNAFDVSKPFLDFLRQNNRVPNNNVELYSHVVGKILDKQEAEREVKKVTAEDRERHYQAMKERLYLEAAFGSQGYTKEMAEYGMSELDYDMIRYGRFVPKQNLSTT